MGKENPAIGSERPDPGRPVRLSEGGAAFEPHYSSKAGFAAIEECVKVILGKAK